MHSCTTYTLLGSSLRDSLQRRQASLQKQQQQPKAVIFLAAERPTWPCSTTRDCSRTWPTCTLDSKTSMHSTIALLGSTMLLLLRPLRLRFHRHLRRRRRLPRRLLPRRQHLLRVALQTRPPPLRHATAASCPLYRLS